MKSKIDVIDPFSGGESVILHAMRNNLHCSPCTKGRCKALVSPMRPATLVKSWMKQQVAVHEPNATQAEYLRLVAPV
jgi:hypothetical protein